MIFSKRWLADTDPAHGGYQQPEGKCGVPCSAPCVYKERINVWTCNSLSQADETLFPISNREPQIQA